MAMKMELITEGYLAEVRLAEILMQNGYQYRWDYCSDTLYVREDSKVELSAGDGN